MKNLNLHDVIQRSMKIREKYHLLETKFHGNEWTVEEDALAFLTDAGLVGRLTMSDQGRWPVNSDGVAQLEHKLGECIWWITVLSRRMDIDINDALGTFLRETEKKMGIDT